MNDKFGYQLWDPENIKLIPRSDIVFKKTPSARFESNLEPARVVSAILPPTKRPKCQKLYPNRLVTQPVGLNENSWRKL